MPYTRERIAPTGSTVAVLVLGDPIVQAPDDGEGRSFSATCGALIGPHDRPVVNQPTGETHAVGIVTRAVECRPVFGVAPAEIRSRIVDLCAVWPLAVGLRDELLSHADPDEILVRTVSLVEAQLRDAPRGLDRGEAAVRRLVDDPTAPIAEVAAELGIGRAHLARELTRLVGLTPRVLARLLRMRRLLAEIDVHDAVGWRELAADLGWFDQAHLIRDFRRHTGVTPSAYLAAQRAGLTDVEPADAAGFVPEV